MTITKQHDYNKKTRFKKGHIPYIVYILGEKNGNAKLTEKEVLQIRSLKGQYRHWEIAKMFKMGRSTITEILLKKKWKHI